MGASCSKRPAAPVAVVKHINPMLEHDGDAAAPGSVGSGAVQNEIEEDASRAPNNDGHDHEAEAEAARIQAEAKLLPPPEAVTLWTEHRYDKDDDAMMKEQGAKAVEWLVQALLAAWCSDELKKHGRRLLAVRAFTANLRFMQLWHETATASHTSVESQKRTVLMAPICARLDELGHELEANYTAESLYDRLGGLTLPLHPLVAKKGKGEARQGLCVPTPPPGWHGRPKHRGEFVYLQVLLMVAAAVNDAFHRWCKDTLGATISELQTPPIKSYGRMRNKMFSADDHRFRVYPRPESNVDINRVLAVVNDPESMTKAAEALSRTCGGVAKQKNGFSLSEAQAAPQYHLRLIMISVLFGMPAPDGSGRTCTYAELVSEPRVRELWDDYAKKPPQAGEPGCEWDADVVAARAWLESKKVGAKAVQMIAEVQMVLPLTCAVRHKMHELYKVARADTDKQLYLDFKLIADKEERIKQLQYDESTALRRACRLGDRRQVQQAVDALAKESAPSLDVSDCLDDAFIVACRNGQVDVLELELMQSSRQRVGSVAAEELSAKCERPSLPVLQKLFETPGWSWECMQHNLHSHQKGHTLLHTACREGHTDVVELCIAHGADVNARRELDGCTGLYLAAQYGHVGVVEALIKVNADHSLHHKITDASPLYTAAESGHYTVVECLIAAKADVFHESQDRPAALIAANNGHKDVVQVLTASKNKLERRKINAAKKASDSARAAHEHQPPSQEDTTSAAARRAAMIRSRKQQEAVISSGHILQELANQLNETFANSGMTLEQLFSTFEKDGDGKISKEEFGRMMKTLGADIPSDTLEHLFTVLDADAGGQIELSEFIGWTSHEVPLYAVGSKANLEDTVGSRPNAKTAAGHGRMLSMAQTKEAT